MYDVNALSSSLYKIVDGPLFLPKVLTYKWSDNELGGISKYLAIVLTCLPASKATIVDFNASSLDFPVLYLRCSFLIGPLLKGPSSSDLLEPWRTVVFATPLQTSSLL